MWKNFSTRGSRRKEIQTQLAENPNGIATTQLRPKSPSRTGWRTGIHVVSLPTIFGYVEANSAIARIPQNILHLSECSYICLVLATAELISASTQIRHLADSLERGRTVPLYRAALVNGEGGNRPFERFRELPFLSKSQMRAGFPENFLGAQRALDALLDDQLVELEHTSGTSSERLPVIFGRGWWNEQEERALRLNRFVAQVLDEHPNVRRAAITAPACTGLTCPTGWLSREQRTLGNTLFVNLARIPFLLSEADLEGMAAEISDWSPQFLDVSPVHGAWFALFCERRGIKFPSLRFVLCSYEFVSVVHRRMIERAFGVPVFDLYGSTETGHLLMADERGAMKSSRETAFLEVVETGSDGIGELVVTTLSNDFMPLLRYRIGDFVAHQLRPYEDIYVVHGRVRDALQAGDGRRVTTWDVDQCFAGVEGIAHYELREPERGSWVLRFVPANGGPTDAMLRQLTTRLQALLKTVREIQTHSMPVLLPTASGKFRLTLGAASTA